MDELPKSCTACDEFTATPSPLMYARRCNCTLGCFNLDANKYSDIQWQEEVRKLAAQRHVMCRKRKLDI
jgi:hypothetical protein